MRILSTAVLCVLLVPACRMGRSRCCPAPVAPGPRAIVQPAPAPAPPPGDPAEGLPDEVRDRLSKAGRMALVRPDRVTLASVDSDAWRSAGGGRAKGQSPYAHAADWLAKGEEVHGTREIPAGTIGRAIFEGMAAIEYSAECWSPRHVLLFERGETRVIAILCFECTGVGLLEAGDTPWNVYPMLDRGHALRDRLNAYLDERGVKREPTPFLDEEEDDEWDDDDEDWIDEDEEDEEDEEDDGASGIARD